MPFTEQNKPLLEAAAAIDFQFTKAGSINRQKHNAYELGLYFVKKAVERHGNRYSYTKVEYRGSHEKVAIICKDHGEFEQIPKDHIAGKGCKLCAGNMALTKEEFTKRAIAVHGDFYGYELINYKNNREKVEIVCPIHGPFLQTPDHHLKGHGCSMCGGSSKLTTEEFIRRARNVHGERYIYTDSRYNSMHEKIEIICPDHGVFVQTPASHIHGGRGCPKCAGQNHNILYLLKCLETGWYKIGITSNLTQRISGIGGNVEEVSHVVLEDPRKHEAILHKRYENAREYNLCVRSGNTEFFSLTEQQVQEVIDYMNEVANE